jgi:catechol 2,3-dioxygenase-like lactoylglutathione lyase family enzyme
MTGPLTDLRFCHLVVGVTDMDRALQFYRGLLGMDVVFDQLISGEPFDAALHSSRRQQGRVVGGVIGGLMVELLSLGRTDREGSSPRRGIVGIQNVSLSVAALDDTYRRVVEAGYQPDQAPFEIGGVHRTSWRCAQHLRDAPGRSDHASRMKLSSSSSDRCGESP